MNKIDEYMQAESEKQFSTEKRTQIVDEYLAKKARKLCFVMSVRMAEV